jgi:hypothetical protein
LYFLKTALLACDQKLVGPGSFRRSLIFVIASKANWLNQRARFVEKAQGQRFMTFNAKSNTNVLKTHSDKTAFPMSADDMSSGAENTDE